MQNNGSDQSNFGLNRDALIGVYGTQKEECIRVVLTEKFSGKTHEFYKPIFGSLILEHDPIRTVILRLGALGNKVGGFTTYEPVSLDVDYA
ncbi:MAG: hypothetical protein WCP16_02310 [Pseudanabaena sp. ELA645]